MAESRILCPCFLDKEGTGRYNREVKGATRAVGIAPTQR